MGDYNIEWNKKTNTRLVEGKQLVFHCHHYNCHLQKTIEDAKMIDGKGIQTNTAREVAYEHFIKAFTSHPELNTPKMRLAFAAKLFQIQGFGIVNFGKTTENGGIVKCPVSHYAKGWITKWGKRKTPTCHFNTGWIAGVLAAAYNKQRYHFEVTETQCEAVKGKGCSFKVEVI